MNAVDRTTAHRELMHEVRDLLKAVRVVKSELAPLVGTIPAGSVSPLMMISAGRGRHVKQIAAECALDPSTVSRAVAALVQAGLVGRTADPDDGRASVLTVTDAGRSALDETLSCYDRRTLAAVNDWTPDDLRVLTALLRRFTADLMTHKPTLEVAR